jgi:hypothetical protein
MTRHSTAADKELPEDLPQELWAADRVWVRRGGATRRPSCLSTTAPTPSSSAASATSGSSWMTGRTTSPPPSSSPAPAVRPSPQRCRPGAAIPTAAPPRHCRSRREQPAPEAPPKPVRFNLAPTSPPAAADPGTIFPGKPARFSARSGEASPSRYPQRNRGPPAWQWDYTFFAASRDQEAGGSSVGTLRQGCYTPLHTTSTARDTQYYATSPEPVSLDNIYSHLFTVIMYICIPRIKSVHSCLLC